MPTALDLFCCGGGASMGLHRAGFEVTGVDIEPQPYYPFRFCHADALNMREDFLRSFDLIWASPPCQRFSLATKARGKRGVDHHFNLIPPTRQALIAAGVPSIIENVPAAPLRADLMLCGSMFDLRIVRHRIFECRGFDPGWLPHGQHHPDYITVTGHTGIRPINGKRNGKRDGRVQDWAEVMGIDWLPSQAIKEAVPPAYAEYLGRRVLA